MHSSRRSRTRTRMVPLLLRPLDGRRCLKGFSRLASQSKARGLCGRSNNNAPERMNTISGPMLNDLTRLLIRANEDRDVRCVILTGNGRAFCAGLDLRKERSGDGLSSASSATSLDLRNTPPTVLQAMDKPTICAV
ncbi:enoyl-CoA hydratase/isomerase family protein, partial [Lacticaseibacillus rhamnosus]